MKINKGLCAKIALIIAGGVAGVIASPHVVKYVKTTSAYSNEADRLGKLAISKAAGEDNYLSGKEAVGLLNHLGFNVNQAAGVLKIERSHGLFPQKEAHVKFEFENTGIKKRTRSVGYVSVENLGRYACGPNYELPKIN